MENTIDIKSLYKTLKQHFLIILFVTLAVAFIAAFVYSYFVPEKYTSKALLYVESTNETTDIVGLTNITAAQELAKICQVLFTNDAVVDDVINQLNVDFTRKELASMVSVSPVNATEVMQISVECEDPRLSAMLVNQFIVSSYDSFQKNIQTGTIAVVDYADIPTQKSYPSIGKSVFIYALLAAVLSYAVAFLIDFMNKSVKSEDNLTEKYDIPTFASIPDFNNKQSGASYYKYRAKETKHSASPVKEPKTKDDKDKLYTDYNRSTTAEAYNSIRINLQFSAGAKDKKIIAFTSCNPSEGKSTTVTNTAISFANAGFKVLLIDADLRRPNLHKLLKIDRKIGLSYLLCDFANIDEILVKNVNNENLDVVPVGVIPPNPSELLSSPKLIKMLEKLLPDYDYIFIDTPPVNIVSDMLMFNKIAAGLVFVVREGSTTYPEIDEAIQRISMADGKILGFVRNFCVFHTSGYYKKNKYGYSKHYVNYSYNNK